MGQETSCKGVRITPRECLPFKEKIIGQNQDIVRGPLLGQLPDLAAGKMVHLLPGYLVVPEGDEEDLRVGHILGDVDKPV